MEYGTFLCDTNYMRYVGWEYTTESNDCVNQLFNKETISSISKKITELLQGLRKDGRDIVVSDNVICSTMSDILNKEPTNKELGNIYTRYTIPNSDNTNGVTSIIDRTINLIVTYIRNEYEMIEQNKKLSIWTTVYGDFNEHGLRQHAPIKLRNRHPQYMAFNMNY